MEEPILTTVHTDTSQVNKESISDVIKNIESILEKDSARLKQLQQLVETLPEDEAAPTIVVTPGSTPTPSTSTGTVEKKVDETGLATESTTGDDDKFTKAQATQMIQNLTNQISQMREILDSGLKASALEAHAKVTQPK